MVAIVLILGLCVGSFLNVLILRLPKGEDVVWTPSHCPRCGHRLRWGELIPVVSFVIQRGRCRNCGGRISLQYPAVELANGLLWLLVGWCYRGDLLLCGVYCALSSCLLALSVIDWRHYIIPDGINVCVFVLGLIRLVADWENRSLYAWGFVAVGGIFWLLHLITGGNGMGLGDVKLAAAAGLLLGWQKMIPAAFLASLSGICIHGFRMKRGAGNRLAFGPYLSFGILLTTLAGEDLIQWYLGL